MPTYEISFFQPKYKEETGAGRKICLLFWITFHTRSYFYANSDAKPILMLLA